MVGVRAELSAGDLRPLHLGWSAACSAWDRDVDVVDHDGDDLEPPNPPGLGALTAAQQALASLLRLDAALIASAAQTSPPLEPTNDVARVARLPTHEKDQLLVRVARGEALRARTELLRRLHDDDAPGVPSPPRRTAGALLDDAHVGGPRRIGSSPLDAPTRKRAGRLRARRPGNGDWTTWRARKMRPGGASRR